MRDTKNTANVVPFRGEMYPDISPSATPPPQSSGNVNYLLFLCVCMVGMGVALGATVTYNSPEQTQIREMKSQVNQLKQVKTQLCNGG